MTKHEQVLRQNAKQPAAPSAASLKTASFFSGLPNRASSNAAGIACRIPDGFRAAAAIISTRRSTPGAAVIRFVLVKARRE